LLALLLLLLYCCVLQGWPPVPAVLWPPLCCSACQGQGPGAAPGSTGSRG